MREFTTIEVDKWVPSERQGMVKHAGMISPQEAFDALNNHLKEVGLLPDEYFDSNSWDWKGVKELPDYIQASCAVNWGGNEGIYLDIALLYRDENQRLHRFNFATGKTLGETGDDFLRMSRIAAECSMMLNGRGSLVKVSEHNYDNIKADEQEKPSLSTQIQTAEEKTGDAEIDKDKKELVMFLQSLLDEQVFDALNDTDKKYAERLTRQFVDKFSKENPDNDKVKDNRDR